MFRCERSIIAFEIRIETFEIDCYLKLLDRTLANLSKILFAQKINVASSTQEIVIKGTYNMLWYK